MSYTKGPWVVDESRHEGCINRLEPFRHIGMVSVYQAKPEDREENEANCRIIALAPDLFEALEHCVDVMSDPWKHGDLSISRAIARSRAVIARANGEQA